MTRLKLGAVAIAAATALLTSAVAAGGGPSLMGVVWTWQSSTLNNGDVFRPDDPGRYTLEFGDDGRVRVRADCNVGGGPYTITGPRLELGPLISTLAACPPGSLADSFMQQLQSAAIYFMRDGSLLIDLKFDTGTMRFTPAGVDQDTITGVVTYRERIALVPGSTVQVQLQDTSRADAPAIVLAEQTITPTGQVPIPFSLPYRPSQIDQRFRYTLQARITGPDGQLLFISMQSYPVITGGNPTTDIEIVVGRVG